jgi:hypothetical protein
MEGCGGAVFGYGGHWVAAKKNAAMLTLICGPVKYCHDPPLSGRQELATPVGMTARECPGTWLRVRLRTELTAKLEAERRSIEWI